MSPLEILVFSCFLEGLFQGLGKPRRMLKAYAIKMR